MPELTAEIFEELKRRRSPQPFVPFAIIMRDGAEHRVQRSGQFALREEDMMLVSNKGTVRIRLAEVARIEERRVMTNQEEKLREDLVAHLDGTPFKRFSIKMTDGSNFDIVRRFQAAIGLTKGTVVSADGATSRNFHISEIARISDMVLA